MKYKVEISAQAEIDLRGIYEHVVFVLPVGAATEKLLDLAETKLKELEEIPESFQKEEREPWKSRGLRKLQAENFLVYYVVNEQVKTVTVIRVAYGG